MSDSAVLTPAARTHDRTELLAWLGVAVVLGGGLAAAARASAAVLLGGVAAVQVLLVAAWFVVAGGPGRRGAALVVLAAAAGADVAVAHWPHSKLGTLAPVLALAIPVIFVHQLARGLARVRLVESVAAVALLVLAVVGLPAFVQLRHEFQTGSLAWHVAVAAVGAAAAALVIGLVVDLVVPAPRFDPVVPRGLPGLLVAVAAGAVVGYLVLRHETATFTHVRAAGLGAICGFAAALLSVAGAFAVHASPRTGAARLAVRSVLGVGLALCGTAPAAFLVGVALRS